MMQKLNYTRCDDYYIPDIRLPEEIRTIGRWGRMHRDYIMGYRPVLYTQLCLNGELWTYLAALNEQTQNRLELIIEQMKATEGVTECILHEFVEKIIIHNAEEPYSRTNRRQEVDIYYKGIGILEMSKVFGLRQE